MNVKDEELLWQTLEILLQNALHNKQERFSESSIPTREYEIYGKVMRKNMRNEK